MTFEFDYTPSAFQWLAALYAPAGLLTFPIAAIPEVPKVFVTVWFLLCVGALWYWLALQIEELRAGAEIGATGFLHGQYFNWAGLLFSISLCLVSAASAFHGGGFPAFVGISGFVWGLVLSGLFARNIKKMKSAQ